MRRHPLRQAEQVYVMNNSCIIKHEKYGLRILLDPDREWDELLSDVEEKFRAAAGFFGNAELTLTFAGRTMTEEEEDAVVRIIAGATKICILCVFVEDPARNGIFLRAANLASDRKSSVSEPKSQAASPLDLLQMEEAPVAAGERYQMLLRSLRDGEIYKTPRTVIVVGNVEEGAALTSARDIIVLGSVRGVVRAGDGGENGRHFVVSSDLRPKKLTIDGVSLRARSRLFSKAAPAMAAVKNGEIVFVPFDGNMEELLG